MAGGLHHVYARGNDRRNVYGATHIESDEHLLMAVAYIVRNPVKAGLCEHPEQWPWSSHRATLEQAEPAWLDAARLLWYFESRGGNGHRRYAELTADGAG